MHVLSGQRKSHFVATGVEGEWGLLLIGLAVDTVPNAKVGEISLYLQPIL